MTIAGTRARPLRLSDFDRVAEILGGVLPRPPDPDRLRCDLEGRQGLARNLGLERDGRLIAVALIWVVADEVEIHDLAVAADSRRRGHGAELLRAVLDRARLRSARIVRLEVESTNRAAIELYLAAGFRETGRRAGYYGPGRGDAILMETVP